MRRREFLFGGGCAAALAGAEWLRPRRSFSLMGKTSLASLIPTRFGDWAVEPGGEIVVPRTPGSLADTLYGAQVTRSYRHRDGGAPVMLLAAHGDSQSDLLQLHRPESCYPAIGFSISERHMKPVRVRAAVAVPAVAMNARAPGRVEDVLYWTRLGDFLPTTASEQRRDRLKTAMSGFVADGILVRASAIRGEAPAYAMLAQFLADLVVGVAPGHRPALIGTERAKLLA